MIGILNLDKPGGITSAAAVGRLRRSSGEKRVGHGGTLDPSATGVLPIFFGRATVLAEHLSAQGKRYTGDVVLGWGSTTDDADGVLSPTPVPEELTVRDVEAALQAVVGDLVQAPPAYSAVKIDGQRSYKLARQGEAPEPKPRVVRLEAAGVTGMERVGEETVVGIAISCGPGFYVRALARDLGRALGTAGHLRALRRTGVGPLDESTSVPLEEAEGWGAALEEHLLPASLAVSEMIEVIVLPADEGRLGHGMDVPAPVVGDGSAFARAEDGRLLAIGELTAGRFRPRRLVEASA